MSKADELVARMIAEGRAKPEGRRRTGRPPKLWPMPVLRIQSLSSGKVTTIEQKPEDVVRLEAWLDGKPPVLPK